MTSSNRMSRVDLSHLLDARCFPKATYSLFGSHGDDAVVLDNRGGQWVVFYAKRGDEENVSKFDDEASACNEVLRRLEIAVPPRMRWTWYLSEQGFEVEFSESAEGVAASLRRIGSPAVLMPKYGIGSSQEDAARSAAERWRLEQRGTTAEAERSLSEAVVIWTGYGAHERPQRDEQSMVEHFGEAAAVDLLPRVRMLEEDFYRSDARHFAGSLEEMSERAMADFRQQHPSVAEAAVAALAWCYSFDFK